MHSNSSPNNSALKPDPHIKPSFFSSSLTPILIIVLTLALAGLTAIRYQKYQAGLLKAIRTQNQLKMESTLEHIEEFLGSIYSNLLYISNDPFVKAMNAGSRAQIQSLYDHQWKYQRLVEIYVIKSDFNGTRPPFMTFERGTDKRSVKEVHSLENEEEEYKVQIEQIRRFTAAPKLKGLISKKIRLCLEQPDGTLASGIVYSVPVVSGKKLVGIVAAMITTQRIAEVLELGSYAEMAVLVSASGHVFGCQDLPAETAKWFEKKLGQGRAAKFFAAAPESFQVNKWTTIWAPAGKIISDQRWWLAFQFDKSVYLGQTGFERLLQGWGMVAAILLVGIVTALLARIMLKRFEERLAFLGELKHSEEELKKTNDQLDSIIESSLDSIIVTDNKGYIKRANRYSLNLLGYSEDEIIDKHIAELSPTEAGSYESTTAELVEINDVFFSHTTAMISKLNETGKLSNWNTYFMRKDKKIIPVEQNIVFLYNRQGEAIGGVGIVRDITEREKARNELIRSNDFLESVFENSKDGIIVTDTRAAIIKVNDAAAKLLKYKKEELEGEYTPLLAGGDQEIFRKAADSLEILFEQGHIIYETQHVAKDGERIDVECSSSQLIDKAGNNIGAMSVIRDIRERKQLEDRLQQAQKMEAIGTLAGGIAHDFNNILAAIIGYSEMSLYELPDDNPVKKNLEQILKSGLRAKDLVKQILAFSRKGEQERRPLQLQPIIKEAVKLLRASIPTTIEIRQRINEDTGIVMANPTQIHQILMNICTNAAQAMQQNGGVLEIALADTNLDSEDIAPYPELSPGPYVKLTISDTGMGIDSKNIDKIFDPFFTTKEVGKGTGMGLAVVHGIVKSHNGEVIAESEWGKGTKFTILLPGFDQEAEKETEPSTELLKGKECILFVDDEEFLVSVGQQMLESLGYSVIADKSSTDALELFRREPERFDLVITDQTMPHMTGYELAKQLMRIRSDIPIILCTGYSETVTFEKIKAAGIKELVMKPLIRREMAATIRKVLDKTEI